MTMADITDMLQNLAFPAVVTIYLLVNSRKDQELFRTQIDQLRKTVEKNSSVIEKLVTKIDKII
jgi:hypothetical protein